ncbi:FHA domain-containing protein [Pectinatus cerevisiiphilus]|uniref:FHA domain-containing protein n=1 Tax=Pectinatus cerevisiiphilus TaxID=86956 RepID=A0A4R3K2F4_9FIRM|nr:FHA domain-containing protein [Pectinatus cerevisiiphilus]TCS76450.1 FHA domain-containing protein [Pectinatus cerevisiiphilus]
MTIKIAVVALEYALLFCICAFIYKTMRAMYGDLHDKAYEETKVTVNKKVALVILQSYDEKLVNKRILFSDMLTLGRGVDNNIVLADAYVSHHHAVISPVKNQYQLEDLHSRNHTYVNEKVLLGKIFLQNGDIIKIGTTVFKFER